MFLGVIPIFWFEFLSDFWRKSQKEAKKENCANRTFAVAKGTFAVAKGTFAAANCFAAEKAASPRRGRGPKWPPMVHCSKALHCGEDTVHSGLKFLFCF